MDTAFLSSGDLLADRRYSYAEMLASNGDAMGAADLLSQALDLAPDWAAGWMRLGQHLEAAGAQPEAIKAYLQAATLDPDGGLGAQMRLAFLGVGDVQDDQQAAYVATLFDHYASDFEQALVQRLGYVVPDRLAEMLGAELAEQGVAMLARGADLGCGTGLMGERVRGLLSHLEGVDLSRAMVEKTASKGIYDRVKQGGLEDYLKEFPDALDLISAADVLMYCGALAPVFKGVKKALRGGGYFVFSVERHHGEEDQVLRDSLRYAHGRAAVVRELEAADLKIVRIDETEIRRDRGAPVEGLLVLARKHERMTSPVAPGLLITDLPQANAMGEPESVQ